MNLQLHDSKPNHMNPDKDRGFAEAVRNGQIRLATEYAYLIIVELKTTIRDLEAKVAALSNPAPLPAPEEILLEEDVPRRTTARKKSASTDEETTEG